MCTFIGKYTLTSEKSVPWSVPLVSGEQIN